MSHFTLLVIGENPEDQLAPYSEHIVLEPYVKYTKEQLIEHERVWITKYKESFYQRYLDDPMGYASTCVNENHLHYLKFTFPKLLSLNDEQLYQEAITRYPSKMIGKDGEVYSTHNPKSKWDWYVLGGRWKGYFTLNDGSKADQAFKKEISLPIEPTFAVLKSEQWHEQGKMGWWAIVADEKEDEVWQREFQSIITSCDDNTLFSLYDCHI